MPARTYWRAEEPEEDVAGHLWVEHTVPQAVGTASTKPEVSTPEWVDWVEQRMRQERAQAPEVVPAVPDEPLVDDGSAWVRGVREQWASSVVSPEQLPAWQRERERAEQAKRRLRTLTMAGVVAVAVVLVGVLAAGTWWWTSQSDDETPDRAQRVAADSRTKTRAPSSPVVLPADGEHTRIRVLDSGDLEVEQWLRRTGSDSLELAPPEGVEVTELSVLAGSRRVQAPTSLLAPTEVSFPSHTTVYLRYRLSGALERSGTRALATVTSLTPEDALTGSRTIDFANATLLALACIATSGTAAPVPCGADAGAKGWEVVEPLALGNVQVMAQLDLQQTG